MFRLEAAGTRADIEHCRTARIIEVEFCLHDAVSDLDEPLPLLIIELAAGKARRVDLPLSAEDTMHQLLARHLQREESDGPTLQGDVRGDIQDERRLTHGRACRNDDEI